MTALRGIALLGLLLALQAGLYRVWPAAPRYIDLMLLPPVWYGLVSSQRSAMIVGCCGGLLADGWFRVGVFGINGFKKTLIGWLVGALGTRFDLNNSGARFLAGVAAALIDTVIESVLRRLLDLNPSQWIVGDTLIRAGTTGILVVWGFMLAGRVQARLDRRWS